MTSLIIHLSDWKLEPHASGFYLTYRKNPEVVIELNGDSAQLDTLGEVCFDASQRQFEEEQQADWEAAQPDPDDDREKALELEAWTNGPRLLPGLEEVKHDAERQLAKGIG